MTPQDHAAAHDPPSPGQPPVEPHPYQPPAIAWEEPFATMAATSCAAANPFNQNCQARPVG